MIGKGFVREPVELAANGIALDLFVETCGVERLEPGPERPKFLGRQPGDGFLDIFNGGHGQRIAQGVPHAAKERVGPGAALLFTAGPRAGVAIGAFQGKPLYRASLDLDEYCALLAAHGFAVVVQVPEDPACGVHTVWLARLRSLFR